MQNFAYLPATAPVVRTLLPKSAPVTLSQPIPAQLIQVLHTAWKCEHCAREFKTDRGCKQHQNKCNSATITHPTNALIGQTVAIIPVQPLAVQPLVWGSYTLEDLELIVNATYDEIVRWRKNVFMLPSGAAGKAFIRETTRLLNLWTSEALLSGIAWKAIMIMPSLLLQKPKYNSSSKEHSECLKRRLENWGNGQFDVIMSECRAIQKNLKFKSKSTNIDYIAKTFAKHVLRGNVNAALRLLDRAESSGVLPLTQKVLSELQEKHPPAQPADESVLIKGEETFVDPAQFNNIDERAIFQAVMKTRGSAGPSGADANQWRRMLISKNYKDDGKELRVAIAKAARKLCTKEIVTQNGQLDAYLSCRLIPLDKNGDGVRPIGVGEVLRRIVGKSIMRVIKPDILESAGSLQLCAGHTSGCEAAVHAMADIFEEEENDGLLLIDASNAFNALNRSVLLHNIGHICPPMAMYVRNCYRRPSRLFITGGGEITSSEGTTQGDPAAMSAYGVGITPLFKLCRQDSPTVKQAGFADDLIGAEKLIALRKYWDSVNTYGPALGYYPKASKTWLVVKENLLEIAKQIFSGTSINITSRGRKYLGGFVGDEGARLEYANGIVNKWVDQLRVLAEIARSEPQAAYAAFVKGFQHKLSYHLRVIPNMDTLLAPLDNVIDNSLIPALTDGHVCSPDERLLLSLPVKLGGMAIPIFKNKAPIEYANSRQACTQHVRNIKNQTLAYTFDDDEAAKVRKDINLQRKNSHDQLQATVVATLADDRLRAHNLSKLPGASSWLTAMPLEEEQFTLNKREFSDAVRLRYRWPLNRLPNSCPCGKDFDVDHALNCLKGGLVNQRHNIIRNLFAYVMNEVHNDVSIEPLLMPLSGEQLPNSANSANEARADVSVRGFWQDGQKAFFDVKVFNPFAQCYIKSNIEKAFICNEKEKKREYNQRVIQLEHGTFSPLVFTPYGGSSRETEHVIRTLCAKVAAKRDLPYGTVVNWLRTKISFRLIRGAILCVRGSRDWRKREESLHLDEIELIDYTN